MFQTGFHHAAFVLLASLAAVNITQVHFYSRYVVTAVAQRVFHDGFKFSRPMIVYMNVVVGSDLDLQDNFLG